MLRLGHRRERDKRITTHVGLAARAFGARGIILSGEYDEGVIRSLTDVVERWGGPFDVVYEENWRKVIKEWKRQGGIVVHLTMYGINLPDIIDEIRRRFYSERRRILVVVGAEKVPREVYELADYNVAVTNQPHSEVSALAVFLDWLFQGQEMKKEFVGARLRIVPQPRGKKVVRLNQQSSCNRRGVSDVSRGR